MDQASELFKANEDHDLLKCLKLAGINGDVRKVEELSVKFEEHREQLEEVLKWTTIYIIHLYRSYFPLMQVEWSLFMQS
jgi:hypothetical protein